MHEQRFKYVYLSKQQLCRGIQLTIMTIGYSALPLIRCLSMSNCSIDKLFEFINQNHGLPGIGIDSSHICIFNTALIHPLFTSYQITNKTLSRIGRA